MNFGQINYNPDTTSGLDIPVVRLSNGILVANFSSPHSFSFTDGTILPSCSTERSKLLALSQQQIEIETVQDNLTFTDITFVWQMSKVVRDELLRLSKLDGFNILVIPFPVMTSLKEIGLPIGRCRCVCKVERRSQVNHIDRFYI